MNATKYARKMRKNYIHYGLIVQAMDLAVVFYKLSIAAISEKKEQSFINRISRIHALSVKRAMRRSDRYNRYTAYSYGFFG